LADMCFGLFTKKCSCALGDRGRPARERSVVVQAWLGVSERDVVV
jgi:hypothetical protein